MTLNWFLVGQERLGWPLDGQDEGFPFPTGSRLGEGSFKSSAEHCHEGAKMRSAGQREGSTLATGCRLQGQNWLRWLHEK